MEQRPREVQIMMGHSHYSTTGSLHFLRLFHWLRPGPSIHFFPPFPLIVCCSHLCSFSTLPHKSHLTNESTFLIPVPAAKVGFPSSVFSLIASHFPVSFFFPEFLHSAARQDPPFLRPSLCLFSHGVNGT